MWNYNKGRNGLFCKLSTFHRSAAFSSFCGTSYRSIQLFVICHGIQLLPRVLVDYKLNSCSMIDCAGEMVKYGWKSLFILILNNEKFSYIVNVRLSEIPMIKIYRR